MLLIFGEQVGPNVNAQKTVIAQTDFLLMVARQVGYRNVQQVLELIPGANVWIQKEAVREVVDVQATLKI